jgi:hypothetical protein
MYLQQPRRFDFHVVNGATDQLVKAGRRIMANGAPGFSRNIIRLDRCARAVKRQYATDDGVRGFMTGGMSAALGHWYPAKSEKLTQTKGQVHAWPKRWRCP